MAAVRFDLPPHLVATEPPEARGMPRDEVRLMVVEPGSLRHRRFVDLPAQLRPRDLIVVNTSPTMPAAVAGTVRGHPAVVHFSTRNDDGTWTIELRRPDHEGPILDAARQEVVRFGTGWARLVRPAGDGTDEEVRLWRAAISAPGGVMELLARQGRPIKYSYVDREWPLEAYQSVFADATQWPGSAEMASAGRPFTPELVAELRAADIGLAAIDLDAGVSSQEAHEPPQPERYNVPVETAALVNATKLVGGRVIAVGTTVTRALETTSRPDGSVYAGTGWTDLVLGPDRPARVVEGLITGWHPPEASHLNLLEAVAGARLVEKAYATALAAGYLWHEFGDSALFLPDLA